MSEEKSFDEILQLLHEQKDISLIEIDLAGYEWEILTQLLDSGILEVSVLFMERAYIVQKILNSYFEATTVNYQKQNYYCCPS